MSLFPTLFPFISSTQRSGCERRLARWYTADIALHLHADNDFASYWRHVEPQLPALRLLYAAHKGTVVTTLALRDPYAHIRSDYKMWPPRVTATPDVDHSRTGGTAQEYGHLVTLVPFHEYLRTHAAKAWGKLSKTLAHESHDEQNCSSAVIALARRRLLAFDVVGLTSCARQHYRQLGRRLNWTCLVDEQVMDEATSHSHNEYYKPHESNVAFRTFAEASADEELSPEAEAALQRAAACDAPLWADGLRLSGVLDRSMRTVASPGSEIDWIEEAGRRGEC
tara:strand:+ start:562 stop:1404 length:843 start_codon:yes stop_codon:yes gene_type:complete